MALHVYRSNRLEALAEALMALPPEASLGVRAAFEPETYVLQSRGMERWLAHTLCVRHGIFANARFVPVEDLLREVMTAVLGVDDALLDRWRPGQLVWHVAEGLRRAAGDPAAGGALATWLGPRWAAPECDTTAPSARFDRRMLQLAWRIAEVFYRYAVLRPELVAAWEAGDDRPDTIGDTNTWQPVLWRLLVGTIGTPSPGRQLRALTLALGAELTPEVRAKLPPRVVLFGHHTLAPLYLEALAALSRHVDVHLFRPVVGRHAALHENVVKHPLRASFDRLGVELDKLLGALRVPVVTHELCERPTAETLLGRLQRDILDGRTFVERSDVVTERAAEPTIAFHACQGEMRQVEVMRDALLRLLDRDPTLEPRDIAIMTPDLDTYAPLVDAVFRDGDSDARASDAGEDDDLERAGFPALHRAHDLAIQRASPLAEAFLAILDRAGSRFLASDILDLVALPAIAAKAGLEPEHLERCRDWVQRARIRWGRDADHREASGQPHSAHNTWRFGFDRLLLGAALATRGADMALGVLPVDAVEGDDVRALGRFIDYVERLFDELADLATPRTVAAWRERLARLVERLLISSDQSAGDAQPILDELQAMATRAASGGFEGLLDLGAVRAILDEPFEARRPTTTLLSGGLTFCTMLPMRAVPFRVIGLLAMDEGAFPRQSHGLGFDLVDRLRELGDRSPRDDDRMAFLETVLAAREHLIVTWQGPSPSEERGVEPSAPVAELVASVRALVPPGSEVVVQHALQPFSPANFAPEHAWSFDRRYARGARATLGTRTPPAAHWPVPCPPEAHATASGDTELDALIELVRRPARWFCRRRLGFTLGDRYDLEPDREPIELDNLEKWQLRNTLLDQALGGVPSDRRDAALVAAGGLPPAGHGVLARRVLGRDVGAIARRVKALIGGTLPTRLAIDVALNTPSGRPARLVGTVLGAYPAGLVLWQAGRARADQRLELWLRHLARAAAGHTPAASHLVALDTHDLLAPVPGHVARGLLGELADLQERALAAPLAFFPKTSWAWLEAVRAPTGPGRGEPLREAQRLWQGRPSFFGEAAIPGERDDAHVQLVFDRQVGDAAFPFGDATFRGLAWQILGPLMDRLRTLTDPTPDAVPEAP